VVLRVGRHASPAGTSGSSRDVRLHGHGVLQHRRRRGSTETPRFGHGAVVARGGQDGGTGNHALAPTHLKQPDPHRWELVRHCFAASLLLCLRRLCLRLGVHALLQTDIFLLLPLGRLCDGGGDAILELHAGQLHQPHEQHEQIVDVQPGGAASQCTRTLHLRHRLAQDETRPGSAGTGTFGAGPCRTVLRRSGTRLGRGRAQVAQHPCSQRWRPWCAADTGGMDVHARGTGRRQRRRRRQRGRGRGGSDAAMVLVQRRQARCAAMHGRRARGGGHVLLLPRT